MQIVGLLVDEIVENNFEFGDDRGRLEECSSFRTRVVHHRHSAFGVRTAGSKSLFIYFQHHLTTNFKNVNACVKMAPETDCAPSAHWYSRLRSCTGIRLRLSADGGMRVCGYRVDSTRYIPQGTCEQWPIVVCHVLVHGNLL